MLATIKTVSLLVILVNIFSGTQSDFIGSSDEDSVRCMSEKVISRLQLNTDIYESCERRALINSDQLLSRRRRRIEPIFRGKPKPRAVILAEKFHLTSHHEQADSLVGLVKKIAVEYMSKCPPVIYYDNYVEKSDSLLLELLFKMFPFTYFHGEITRRYVARNNKLKGHIDSNCKSYILFLSDPLMTRKIIGPQMESRVLVVARSTQWKLRDFLASEKSSNILNLLVIGESLSADESKARPYVLYTHSLYTDGLGSNKPVVLTSWVKGGLTRPHVNLFPRKFSKGFANHRFKAMAANQPPFIFRIKTLDINGMAVLSWDGIEYRLLNMMAAKLNFSVDISDVPLFADNNKSPVENLNLAIGDRMADIGMSGAYITSERHSGVEMSEGHSKDCAAFITLASKALPKYRAIMGPFQWPVWVALICIYLGGVFPIVFTDRLTLSHLLGNWGEIENMFWYVFGMFTNSLTFSGRYSWGNTQKVSTRLLIGSYWIFTIIITACYTGSIIAFVTLPAFPDTVDSVTDLLGLFFRVGTLGNGGWETWFQNSSHDETARLFQKIEYVTSIQEGIGNVTQSFFWNYAFLGSKAQLEYLVQANFTNENLSKRSALHLSEECFALFYTGYVFPENSVYKQKINSLILLAQQAGLINKIESEVKWVMQRSTNGKLLQASSSSPLRETLQEERQLTTADTEGMFLLMGIGYAVGAIALVSEIVGGITNKCRQIIIRSRKSFSSSNWSSKRASIAMEQEPRTKQEEMEHAVRKLVRKTEARKEFDKEQQSVGFGWRQFNLTRTTLKELYSDYHKPQPEYVLKDGQVYVEEPEDSDLTETTSRSSIDTNEFVVNERHKGKDVIEQVVEKFINEELENTLKTLDHTLEIYNENGSDVEDDNDVQVHGDKINEEAIFGSIVSGHAEENIQMLQNLKLFKKDQDVTKSDDSK